MFNSKGDYLKVLNLKTLFSGCQYDQHSKCKMFFMSSGTVEVTKDLMMLLNVDISRQDLIGCNKLAMMGDWQGWKWAAFLVSSVFF